MTPQLEQNDNISNVRNNTNQCCTSLGFKRRQSRRVLGQCGCGIYFLQCINWSCREFQLGLVRSEIQRGRGLDVLARAGLKRKVTEASVSLRKVPHTVISFDFPRKRLIDRFTSAFWTLLRIASLFYRVRSQKRLNCKAKKENRYAYQLNCAILGRAMTTNYVTK